MLSGGASEACEGEVSVELLQLLYHAVSEQLIVNKDSVLDGSVLAHYGLQFPFPQLLLVLDLQYVVQLRHSHEPIMLLVYLLYSPYDFHQLIVGVDDLHEFLLCDGLEVLLEAVELASVARLVDGVVFPVVLVHVHLLVDLGEHGLVLLVVEPADVDALVLAFVPAGEALQHHFLLLFRDLHPEALEHVAQLLYEDLVLVFLVRLSLYILYELRPSAFNLSEPAAEHLGTGVLVELLVERTVVLGALGGLPALVVAAGVHFHLRGLVLPEVEALRGVDLTAHRQLEVLVGDLPVAV